MTTKEYLKGYRILTEVIRQIDLEIEALEAEADSISAGDEAGRSGAVSNRTERIALRLVDMKLKRERKRAEAWAKREEIENVILMASDPIYGRLLYDRYILGMRWDEIAADICYNDVSNVRGRLHSKALMSVAGWIRED